MEMKAKMNELDLLLATFLKDNIEKFIGPLVNIVNISLQLGMFAREWKMALLHPLIKKAGLDVIKSNFQLFHICHSFHGWWKKLPLVNWFNMQTTMIYHPNISQHIGRIIVVKNLC